MLSSPSLSSDVVAEIERITSKHTAEINRMILDMDLKVSRSEVTDIIENHMHNFQQNVNEREIDNSHHFESEIEKVKIDVNEINKKLEKKLDTVEFTKKIGTKASHDDVDEIADSLKKLEKVIIFFYYFILYIYFIFYFYFYDFFYFFAIISFILFFTLFLIYIFEKII